MALLGIRVKRAEKFYLEIVINSLELMEIENEISPMLLAEDRVNRFNQCLLNENLK